MEQLHDTPAPSGAPTWDITFTRLTHALRPKVKACTVDLARRFKAVGLHSDTQVRQMPRGLSTLLALVGERGLVCIIDITLLDGMALGHGPCTGLEIRLLDACGDVVTGGMPSDLEGRAFHEASAAVAFISDSLDQAATGVYVEALAHFGLLRPRAQNA